MLQCVSRNTINRGKMIPSCFFILAKSHVFNIITCHNSIRIGISEHIPSVFKCFPYRNINSFHHNFAFLSVWLCTVLFCFYTYSIHLLENKSSIYLSTISSDFMWTDWLIKFNFYNYKIEILFYKYLIPL